MVSRNNIICYNKKIIAEFAIVALNFLYILFSQQFEYGLVRTPFKSGEYVTSNDVRTYVTTRGLDFISTFLLALEVDSVDMVYKKVIVELLPSKFFIRILC